MDAENIKDVIDELVGPIVPTGSESIDINRLNNLKKYEKILPMICEDIKIIRDKYIYFLFVAGQYITEFTK